jgi:DNA-directed RNA polymerase specialized sigma24 family protein
LAADSRDALIQYIAHPQTSASLRTYARLRGLTDTADDLVQTVLCEALAAPAVPLEPSELPRWVTGIARHKVVDERRRRARATAAEAEPVSNPTPEASDLLRRIGEEVEDEADRRTLEWVMREHAGESLFEIAREEALNASTLRQRICRLRRQLRARYLFPLLLALGVGAGSVASTFAPRAHQGAAETQSLRAFSGEWRVRAAAPSKYADMDLAVSVRDGSILVRGPTGSLRRELVVDAVSEQQITLRSGDSTWVARFERLGEARLRLGNERGFVELERVR